ncbi:stage V sporulation protein AB [Bacillus fonticola]|uniref:stage V sporulation protein AB n=1 Tax=Bacillus fonticola TaxID=2728853 RepID=UPI001472C933|nr:stage V sporulation protein AB [Bacillus fonticola]
MIISYVLVIFVGFAGGLAVGSGFVAFLTVLNIIPRLTQLTKTFTYIQAYEWSVVIGAVSATWIGLRDLVVPIGKWFAVPYGLLSGVFVGMLAAALTEVLNVLPILAKRIGIDDRIVYLLMAIVLGKVIGSLFHWLVFVP